MKNEIVKFDTPELNVIEQSKAEQIKVTFVPMAEMLSGFEQAYSEIIQESEKEITKDVTTKAKRLRLDIGKVRIETEKIRVAQKDEYLRAGKAIDGVSNILKWAITDKESKLKEIEDYFEIQEQKRLDALQSEREEMISKFVEDAHERNLSSMDSDVWEAYFQTKQKDFNDRIAAEKQAELDRIAKEKAEIERQKAIEAENLKLKKEAEERERIAKIEAEKRAKEETERKIKEDAERKDREEKERIEREAYESKIKIEREEKECIERELKAKQDAEIKAKQDEALRLQAELSKGDEAKVKDLISDLESLKGKYSFKSAKNVNMYENVGLLIDKIILHIQK